MKVASQLTAPANLRRPVVAAAGFFDGMHRGHRKVLCSTIEQARSIGASAWVLTFETHPLRILDPRNAPPLLTCNRHKIRLLKRFDLDGCVLMPFTREFSRLAPEEFVEMFVRDIPKLERIVVGRNWHFGKGAKGDPALLSRLGRAYGFRVTVVSPVIRKGAPVSSTRIREEVQRGRLKEAESMLGRPFSILGRVVKGRTVGRRLGFPTANLDTENEVVPPPGVYAAVALVGSKTYNAVLNFGCKPTFVERSSVPGLELHLLHANANLDLYGRDVEVFFLQRLRAERRFTSPAALRSQISRDIGKAEEIFTAGKRMKEYLYNLP